MKRKLVGKKWPSATSLPVSIARTASTYSRIADTGRSILVPYQFSTVTACETPRPSTIRPLENSSIVAACCAIATGVRE